MREVKGKRLSMKKFLSVTLVLSLILSVQIMASFALGNNQSSAMETTQYDFNDIENHWAKDAIERYKGKGIIHGYTDNTFRPDQQMTRAELAAIINRSFGFKYSGDNNFEDVEDEDWFFADAAKAKFQDYMKGSEIRPNEIASREDVVTAFSFILDLEENNQDLSEKSFSDLENFESDRKTIIEQFSEAGYIQGYPDGTFRPLNPVKRAEFMKIIERVFGYIVIDQEDADNIPQDAINITIINPGIVIDNQNIEGNVYISAGANGQVVLSNMEVKGSIIVSSSQGDESIVLDSIKAERLVLTKSKETIKVRILNSGISEIETKSNSEITFEGKTEVNKVDLNATTNMEIEEDAVLSEVNANMKTFISGLGQILHTYVRTDEIIMENKLGYIRLYGNAIAKIDNEIVSRSNDDYESSNKVAEHKIEFETDGGTAVAGISQNYGTTIDSQATSKTGYTFEGWYSDSTLTNKVVFPYMILCDATLYAKWTINEYTVSFEANGGTAVAGISQNYGTTIVSQATSKTGYTFEGWYSEAGLTNKVAFPYTVSSDATLYAKWTVNQYTIDFETDGGTAVAGISQNYGTTIDSQATSKTGYTFEGWYSEAGLTNKLAFPYTVSGDATLYAKWTVNEYTVSFEANGGTAVAGISQNYGTTIGSQATSKTGYTFEGWYSEAGLTNKVAFPYTVSGDATLYAKWTVNQYTIDFETDGGTAVAGISQNYGTTIGSQATSKEGYTLAGWYSEAGLTNKVNFPYTVSGDATLYAKWTPIDYFVTYFGNASDGGSVPLDANTYHIGDTVTVLGNSGALTKTHYTFSGWNSKDDGTGDNFSIDEAFKMGSNDILFYAKWDINEYTVSFEANGGTAVAGISQNYGTTIGSQATSKTGYTFEGWYSEAGLTNKVNFPYTVSGDATLYAKWTVNQYTIDFETDGGTAVAGISQNYGTTIGSQATSKTGYTFEGWYSEAGLTNKVAFPYTVSGDATLYAKWDINEYTVSFEANGGTAVAGISQNYGTTIDSQATSKEGYTLAGWYSEAGLTNKLAFPYTVSGDATLYAKWNVDYGAGTDENPFKIYTIEDLARIGTLDTDANGATWTLSDDYILMANLDFEDSSSYSSGTVNAAYTEAGGLEGFTPIGYGSYFLGNFDGNDKTINNLYINSTNDEIGLFSKIRNRATIQDLGLTNVNVKGANSVGGLSGYVTSYSTISNCYTTGIISCDSTSNFADIGGLIGLMETYSVVEDSHSQCEVKLLSATGRGRFVGGLIGRSENGTIQNSYSTGNVTGQEDTGGFIAFAQDTTIEDSYAEGNVLSTDVRTGGFVGNAYSNVSITRSYATGDVTVDDDNASGFVGYSSKGVTIDYSYSTGDVISNNSVDSVGGLFGYGTAVIKNSYSTSNISGVNTYAGGVAGRLNAGSVENAYSNGEIEASSSNVGGLAGYFNGGAPTSSIAFNQYIKGNSYTFRIANHSQTDVSNYAYEGMDVYFSNVLQESLADATLSGKDGLSISNINDCEEVQFAGWEFNADSDGDFAYWKIDAGMDRPVIYVDKDENGTFEKLGSDDGTITWLP